MQLINAAVVNTRSDYLATYRRKLKSFLGAIFNGFFNLAVTDTVSIAKLQVNILSEWKVTLIMIT